MFDSFLQIVNGTGLPHITISNLLGDLTVMLVLSAVIVGIAFRTLGKYWDKWRDGEVVSFDRVFVATAIASFVGAIMPALAVFPAASAMFATNMGNFGIAFAWIITAYSAYGINEGINYTYRRIEGHTENKVMTNLNETIPGLKEFIEQKIKENFEKIQKESSSGAEGRHEQ